LVIRSLEILRNATKRNVWHLGTLRRKQKSVVSFMRFELGFGIPGTI
jgi:hypothetical protein